MFCKGYVCVYVCVCVCVCVTEREETQDTGIFILWTNADIQLFR